MDIRIKKPENRSIDSKKQNENGTFKKGISGNPGGRPKNDLHIKLLRDLFGDDGAGLLYILIAQMYNVDINKVGIPNDIGKMIDERAEIKQWDYRKKLQYKRKLTEALKNLRTYDERLACDNAKYLLDKMFGKAKQQIETENINHNHNNNIDITFKKPDKDIIKTRMKDLENEIENNKE